MSDEYPSICMALDAINQPCFPCRYPGECVKLMRCLYREEKVKKRHQEDLRATSTGAKREGKDD